VKMRKKCLFFVAAAAISASASSAVQRTYINPIDVDYRYNFEQINQGVSYRTGADPAIVNYHGAYYLFMTLADGYWRSTDLMHWQFITPSRWPFGGVVAPAAWVDGDRLYIDVRCWRGLARNALDSLKKGDPVVVTGRIFTRNYEHQGQSRTSTTLEAHSVAADLAHCTVVLTRTRRGLDVHPGHDDRTVDAREADDSDDSGDSGDSGQERNGDAPGTGVSPQGERRPDGSRPHLVGAVPGDEG